MRFSRCGVSSIGADRYWVIHAGVPSSISFAGLDAEQVAPWLVQHHPHALL